MGSRPQSRHHRVQQAMHRSDSVHVDRQRPHDSAADSSGHRADNRPPCDSLHRRSGVFGARVGGVHRERGDVSRAHHDQSVRVAGVQVAQGGSHHPHATELRRGALFAGPRRRTQCRGLYRTLRAALPAHGRRRTAFISRRLRMGSGVVWAAKAAATVRARRRTVGTRLCACTAIGTYRAWTRVEMDSRAVDHAHLRDSRVRHAHDCRTHEREAVFFDSPAELREKTAYYTANDAARARIAAGGRERCLRSGYDSDSTMRKVVRAVEATL
ncbi:MAG: hypothetical protein DMG02_30920 [Acidobacteria bacterium]|nr:MAG: hypothetical protein DMG02_30920 [Acidobacteriota bacterium]